MRMDMQNDRENDGNLRKRLTLEQYRVTQEKITEPPYANKYWNCDEEGIYKCVCCGTELFKSEDKYSAGCGWPSFTHPVDNAFIEEAKDNSEGMERTEVACAKCGAHLGHVFPEEDTPTGLRYCINSAALNLEKKDRS